VSWLCSWLGSSREGTRRNFARVLGVVAPLLPPQTQTTLLSMLTSELSPTGGIGTGGGGAGTGTAVATATTTATTTTTTTFLKEGGVQWERRRSGCVLAVGSVCAALAKHARSSTLAVTAVGQSGSSNSSSSSGSSGSRTSSIGCGGDAFGTGIGTDAGTDTARTVCTVCTSHLPAALVSHRLRLVRHQLAGQQVPTPATAATAATAAVGIPVGAGSDTLGAGATAAAVPLSQQLVATVVRVVVGAARSPRKDICIAGCEAAGWLGQVT
jgi:hypothetical protein